MKIAYPDAISALVAVHFIYKRSGDSQWPYRCPTCGNFNTGHTPKEVVKYIFDFMSEKRWPSFTLVYTLGEKLREVIH